MVNPNDREKPEGMDKINVNKCRWITRHGPTGGAIYSRKSATELERAIQGWDENDLKQRVDTFEKSTTSTTR